MTRITIDAALAAQLAALSEEAHLCDPDGKVVARVKPPLIPPGWEPVGPEISREELDRRAKSDGPWYTTDEVLRRLEKP